MDLSQYSPSWDKCLLSWCESRKFDRRIVMDICRKLSRWWLSCCVKDLEKRFDTWSLTSKIIFTSIFHHALNASEAASFDVLSVVEVVRQAVTSLDVKLHVALDDAVFFHVSWKILQRKFVVENASAVADRQRSHSIRAIRSLRANFNKSFLLVRNHSLDCSLAWIQRRLVDENFYSFAVHRRHRVLFD